MKASIGDRMKAYEACSTFLLPRRTPLIVRVDGRAFHTLTRGMVKPFDALFMDAMVFGARAVADEAQGFEVAYVQSDEASFYLQDCAELDTDPWFGKSLSKIVSLSAAIMSVAVSRALGRDAHFDSRAFVVPESDVANYFLWRAKDWSRNSLSMYAQSHFSHKQLHGKGRADMHEMLHGVGRNWATDLTERERNGTFLIRTEGGTQQRTDVLPTWDSVSSVVRSAEGARVEVSK